MLSSNIFRVCIAVGLTLPVFAIGAPAAYAEDLEFTLNNNSSSALTQFYVESTELKNWGENILTSSIAPGESATVTIADGKRTCMYDIRGVFADGDVEDEEELNLCDLGSYTYSDGK